jgi:hypothetical protein
VRGSTVQDSRIGRWIEGTLGESVKELVRRELRCRDWWFGTWNGNVDGFSPEWRGALDRRRKEFKERTSISPEPRGCPVGTLKGAERVDNVLRARGRIGRAASF